MTTVGIPLMPIELQIANVSNAITLFLGIIFLFLALKDFGSPKSLNYFKMMILGIFLYSLFHEGLDIATGTAVQDYMPPWIYNFWPVLILQTIGPIVFLIGAYLYNKEMFRSMGGGS